MNRVFQLLFFRGAFIAIGIRSGLSFNAESDAFRLFIKRVRTVFSRIFDALELRRFSVGLVELGAGGAFHSAGERRSDTDQIVFYSGWCRVVVIEGTFDIKGIDHADGDRFSELSHCFTRRYFSCYARVGRPCGRRFPHSAWRATEIPGSGLKRHLSQFRTQCEQAGSLFVDRLVGLHLGIDAMAHQ